MKSVRLAVCGAGNRGSSITLNVICALEDVEIVSVCDLRETNAQVRICHHINHTVVSIQKL